MTAHQQLGERSHLDDLLAALAPGITRSPVDSSISLLQRQAHDVVRLAAGSPAAERIPTADFLEVLVEEARGPDAFDYGPTEGDPLRRSALPISSPTAADPPHWRNC